MSGLWPPAVIGGAELYAERLATELRAAGHEVAAVTRGVPGDDVVEVAGDWPARLDRFASAPAWRQAVVHARDLWDPLAAAAVARAVDRHRPDVVHTHAVAGLSPAVLAVPGRTGVRHVHTAHDYWLLCQRSSRVRADGVPCTTTCGPCRPFAATRRGLLARRPPDVLVVPSRSVADAHRHLVPDDRLRVLPLPVDDAPPRVARPPGRPPVLGYLGRITASKGVPTLLAAFADLAPGTARLVLAGSDELGVEPQAGVEVPGWLEGAAREAFFERIDALVIPSEWQEPGSLASLEARARGIPVIASRVGALPDNVADSCRPLLFAPGDRRALADSLRRFAADPVSYAPEPWAGRPWDEHARTLVGLYAEDVGVPRG